MELQKPTLTRDMLKGLGSKEAKMRAVYEVSKNNFPVEPSLFEDTIAYFRKEDPRIAADLYRLSGDEARFNQIYRELSLDFERKGDLENAKRFAWDVKRKRRLEVKEVKQKVQKGDFWEAAWDAKSLDLYPMAIQNFIRHDLSQDRAEGVYKAAEIARYDSTKLWDYFAEQCRNTGKKEIIEAAAIQLKENGKLPLALDFYQILGDNEEIKDLAIDLEEHDIALGAMLKLGEVGAAERYASNNGKEDKLPEIYELGIKKSKEDGDDRKAAYYAEKLGRFSEAIDLYEQKGNWYSAAELAGKQGLKDVRDRNLRTGLKEYEEKKDPSGALTIAVRLGLSGEELRVYQRKALDKYEKNLT